jgi:hypothetical protein
MIPVSKLKFTLKQNKMKKIVKTALSILPGIIFSGSIMMAQDQNQVGKGRTVPF